MRENEKEKTRAGIETGKPLQVAGDMIAEEENTITGGKPICSICYEDLKPIVEDLQTISICGHVFHELCLQQWFEYCPNLKKRNCPVCKQSCLGKDACRLYFQSVGDQNDLVVSKNVGGPEEDDPEVLRREVKRLEWKVSGLTSALGSQKKETEGVTEELHLCKEQLKKEVGEKIEALREKSVNQHQLQLKSEECGRLNLECSRLQERNMDLGKELAALKLVSDLNIDEDEVLKLASFGKHANTKDTVDALVKSLVIRNRSYKELLAKCNYLGRGEARSSEKLVKAQEKIDKLKMRVKELETILEGKENGALRALKASKKCSEGVVLNRASETFGSLALKKHPVDCYVLQNSLTVTTLARTECLIEDPPCFKESGDSTSISRTDAKTTKESAVIGTGDDVSKVNMDSYRHSNANSKHQKSEEVVQKSAPPLTGVAFDVNLEAKAHNMENVGISDNRLNKDVEFNIRKESPSQVQFCKPGDICFSGGLLGPDGTNRFLGKWCKRGQSTGSSTGKGYVSGSGNLIAVGADGRGGRIKVLRSQPSLADVKENSQCAKRLKYGAPKTSASLQSQGCLQIEHFFGRANH